MAPRAASSSIVNLGALLLLGAALAFASCSSGGDGGTQAAINQNSGQNFQCTPIGARCDAVGAFICCSGTCQGGVCRLSACRTSVDCPANSVCQGGFCG